MGVWIGEWSILLLLLNCSSDNLSIIYTAFELFGTHKYLGMGYAYVNTVLEEDSAMLNTKIV